MFSFYFIECCVQVLSVHLFPFWRKHNYVFVSKCWEYKNMINVWILRYVSPDNSGRSISLKFQVKPILWSACLQYKKRGIAFRLLLLIFQFKCGTAAYFSQQNMSFQVLDILISFSTYVSLHCNRRFYLTGKKIYISVGTEEFTVFSIINLKAMVFSSSC